MLAVALVASSAASDEAIFDARYEAPVDPLREVSAGVPDATTTDGAERVDLDRCTRR